MKEGFRGLEVSQVSGFVRLRIRVVVEAGF